MPGDPFYRTAAWLALRRQALIRDGYRCTVCGIDVSGRGKARVDHIKLRRTHRHLELELSNIRTLCSLHDNQSHREKPNSTKGAQRIERFTIRGADEGGWPLDPFRR